MARRARRRDRVRFNSDSEVTGPDSSTCQAGPADAMTEETNHARQRRGHPEPEPKTPSHLPGPNRFPNTARYGEALAPGTIPDEERKEREREGREKDDDEAGVDRP